MRSEDIRKRLKDIDEFLPNQYKESKEEKETRLADLRTAVNESNKRSHPEP